MIVPPILCHRLTCSFLDPVKLCSEVSNKQAGRGADVRAARFLEFGQEVVFTAITATTYGIVT
jgi:hypothetical protein